jgi:hypothetical protein
MFIVASSVSNFAPGGHHAGFTPLGAMLDDPVYQRLFKPNVMTGLLGLDPFVLQDFLTFGLKVPVKQRILEQIAIREPRFCFVRHIHLILHHPGGLSAGTSPLGIHQQQQDAADERERSDNWRNKVPFGGLDVYSQEVDRFSRGREGEARVSEHYDA